MQAIATNYRGIEFVRISDLPSQQRIYLSYNLDQRLIIKVSVDGVILNDCIQYGEYKLFYDKYWRANESGTHANELFGTIRDCHTQCTIRNETLINKRESLKNSDSFLQRLYMLLKRMKLHFLVSVLLFSTGAETYAQGHVDQGEIPNHSYILVCYLDGYRTYFGAIDKLLLAEIYSAEFSTLYNKPSGALIVRTNHFVNELRPEFYRNLQKWLRGRIKRNFIIDGKPSKNTKLLRTITEQDIEGFSFLNIGGKELIEIILSPDFSYNR